jgi:putative ABC transport system ATP-binding protein
MLRALNLTKTYQSGGRPLTVLKEVSLEIEPGGFLAVLGPSGCGKTTLLSLLAGLDLPTSGTVEMDGEEITRLSEDARARLRGEKVGFVFQTFQLIPTLTALENVMVPIELRGHRRTGARELLARVGLEGREHHYPAQLSGGEQQRVAIARAFANDPAMLFADEPTGNLDGATGGRIIDLLAELNRESGTTLVLVTHDPDLAGRARRTLHLRDGVVVDGGRAG